MLIYTLHILKFTYTLITAIRYPSIIPQEYHRYKTRVIFFSVDNVNFSPCFHLPLNDTVDLWNRKQFFFPDGLSRNLVMDQESLLVTSWQEHGPCPEMSCLVPECVIINWKSLSALAPSCAKCSCRHNHSLTHCLGSDI